MTSLNRSGEPTVKNLQEGINFSSSRNIPLFLIETGKYPAASFPIIYGSDLSILRASRDPQQALKKLKGKVRIKILNKKI